MLPGARCCPKSTRATATEQQAAHEVEGAAIVANSAIAEAAMSKRIRLRAASQCPGHLEQATMQKPIGIICRTAVAGVALAAVAGAATAAKPQPFKITNIHFETNSSACDMGIQISF